MGPGGGGAITSVCGHTGDMPTSRVDFLTQNYFRQGANLVSTKCWAKKYFRPSRKLGFGH